ncbi:hypothetical protein ACPRNU_20910 [Chromobacterium vaccinii]|uniref:hypothetical protein n=1 Tax=Chromobacterium vaccinii TaxID=1108595 RepID=UPI003C74B82D
MSISSLSNSSGWISQLGQISGARFSGDANGVGDAGTPPPGPPPGGGLISAIGQALSQIGVGGDASSDASSSDDDSTSSTSSSQDPRQAMAAFMQNLMAALHDQSGQTGASSSDGGVSGSGGYGRPDMQTDLASLIQQLNASSGSSDTGSASSDASTLSSLQQSFQNLVSALGGSGSGSGSGNGNATLSGFLQALESSVPGGASASGSIVSASA